MQFSAGSVLSRALSVLLKNFVPFVAISLVVYAPVILMGAVTGSTSETRIERVGNMEFEITQANQGMTYFLVLLQFIAQYAVAGAVAYGVFQSLKGDKVITGECLKKGIQRLLPVIGVAIVAGIGIVLGLILLVIPGIILACMWYVAVPAAVVEKPGVMGALERSSTLTKGSRMSIFAVFLLIIVLSIGVSVLLVGVLMGLGPVLGAIVNITVGSLFGLYGGVCAAVAYHDLRVMKEGIGVEDLVKVFE